MGSVCGGVAAAGVQFYPNAVAEFQSSYVCDKVLSVIPLPWILSDQSKI